MRLSIRLTPGMHVVGYKLVLMHKHNVSLSSCLNGHGYSWYCLVHDFAVCETRLKHAVCKKETARPIAYAIPVMLQTPWCPAKLC